jgi:hypothetical protein
MEDSNMTAKTHSNKLEYDPTRDRCLWSKEQKMPSSKFKDEDKWLVVDVRSYDLGEMKVQVSMRDGRKGIISKLIRLSKDQLEIALPLLSEAYTAMVEGKISEFEPLWGERNESNL